MEYKNVEVALRIKNLGTQASRGSYEFEQTGWEYDNKNGEIHKYPKGKLKVKQLPCYKECYTRTILRSEFVHWAVSDDARPKWIAAPRWKQMSKKNRLLLHIEKYVTDLYGYVKFEYELIH